MGDHLQKSLFLQTLRGPLFIDSMSKPQPLKFIKKHDKCARCLRPTQEKSQSVQHYINISDNLEKKDKAINSEKKGSSNQKGNVTQFQVSGLKQMKNQSFQLEKEKIFENNMQLGFRMRHSYRQSSSSKQQPQLSSLERDQVDLTLANSALRSLQQTKREKEETEWKEFSRLYPKEAEMIKSFDFTRKKMSKKGQILRNNFQTFNTEKSFSANPRNRRQSNSSSLTRDNILQQAEESIEPVTEENGEEVILLENTKDQPDVVLNFLLGGQRFWNGEEELLSKWIYTLPQETRMEIEKDKKFFPIPRNIDQSSIRQGLDKLFGTGKSRRLRPGEEAALMETINSFLNECLKNPSLITYSINYILNNHILKLAGLDDLQDNSLCMKQLECHWKLQATRFRYSGNPFIKSKKFEKQLQVAHARGHFLDLTRKDNLLVQYLLKHQK